MKESENLILFILILFYSVQLTSFGGNLMFTFDSNVIINVPDRSKRNIDKRKKYKPTIWNYVKETPNNKSWSGNSNGRRTKNDVPAGRRNNLGSHGGSVSGPRILNLTDEHSVFIVVC
jgi:hypothetical protein